MRLEKMRVAFLLLAFVVSGCSTTGTRLQSECEARHADFPSVVQCTRAMVAEKIPSKLDDPKAKLYLLRGQQLAVDVAAGRMTDIDARVAWQRLYLDLWPDQPAQAAMSNQAAALMLMQMSKQNSEPAYQIVRPPEVRSTTCTTGPLLGSTIQTNCESR